MPLGVRFPRLLHLSPYDTRSTSMYSSRSGIYCTDRSRSRTAVVAVFSVASITFGCLLLERVTMLFCWRCVACQPRGETSGERTGQWWNSWWWEDVERRRSGRSANKRACVRAAFSSLWAEVAVQMAGEVILFRGQAGWICLFFLFSFIPQRVAQSG